MDKCCFNFSFKISLIKFKSFVFLYYYFVFISILFYQQPTMINSQKTLSSTKGSFTTTVTSSSQNSENNQSTGAAFRKIEKKLSDHHQNHHQHHHHHQHQHNGNTTSTVTGMTKSPPIRPVEVNNYNTDRPDNHQYNSNLENGQWNLQFDPNYFSTLNAENHRPIDSETIAALNEKAKHTITGTNIKNQPNNNANNNNSNNNNNNNNKNMYYYTPESYGKTTHKNHQTGSYTYLYPAQSSSSSSSASATASALVSDSSSDSSSTTTTSTSSTTTPTPLTITNDQYNDQNNNYNNNQDSIGTNEYSEPALSGYSLPFNEENLKKIINTYNNNKRPTTTNMLNNMNMNYEGEDLNYYDGNDDQVEGKFYYPMRTIKKKHYSSMGTSNHDYYGSDLTSLSTSNDNTKQQSQSQPNSQSHQSHHQTQTQTQTQTQHPHEQHQHEQHPNVPPVDYSNLHDEGGMGLDYDLGPGDTGGYADADLKYGTGSNMKFPSKYHGASGGAYYPAHHHPPISHSSFYPSHYYPAAYAGGDYSSAESHLPSKSSWLGPGITAGLLFGIIPLSILIASMVPAFVGVPIVSTATVGKRRRKRQIDEIIHNSNNSYWIGIQNSNHNNNNNTLINQTKVLYNPALDIIADYGFSSMNDPNCLQEIFCMLTVQGKQINSNVIQKFFYNIAKWTPDDLVKSTELGPLFSAVQIDKCQDTFKCAPKKSKLNVIK